MLGLPSRVVVVVGAVCGLALAALIVAARRGPVVPDQHQAILLILLGGMLLAARLAPLPVAQHQKLLASTAPLLAATLLLPALLAMTIAGVAVLAGQRIRRQPWMQALFNAAVTVLQVVAGVVVFATLAAGRTFSTLPPGWLLLLTGLTALTMYTVSTGLVELVVVVQRWRFVLAEVWQRRQRDLPGETALVLLGLLIAMLAAVHTWMVVLLAVPALVVYRSLRASLLLQEQLAHQAFHDPLTDLPNRVLFTSRLVEALARAKRADGTVAVLYLDLDGFKQINDSMGHSMGDVLLRVIATRLQENLGPAETVARFGGDEFTALVADKDPAGVVRLAEQLLATVRVPVVSDGQQFSVSGSIGIVLSNGQDSAEVLLRNADIAMYQAKAAGKGRWSIFAPAMYTAVQERVTLERELREAVPHGELRVHYQPTVDLRTNQMVGAEALVRWQHPTRGLLQPDHFIALAEETGLIVPIGRWVLREACHQARRWQTVAPAGDSFSVNVNLSPRQLLEPGLVGEVAAILAETDLSDGALVLEVTESVMMQDADAALCTLRALKTLGVQLALDDFGTGYSSLSYVHRFPFDVLKIDQAFIRGIETNRRDAALVSTIVAMGQSLQLRTVAEGIESAAQAAALAQLGCDTGQGYYFARPLPADVLDVLLRTEQAAAVELGNVRWLPRTRTGSAG